MWVNHGHDVKIVFDGKMSPERFILSDPPWLTGSSPEFPLVQFSVGVDHADFSATSRCVIGDEAELGAREVELFDEARSDSVLTHANCQRSMAVTRFSRRTPGLTDKQ